MLISSVLLPIASYGGEIFGMSQARAAKLQTVIVMFNNKWNQQSIINNNAENIKKALNSMYFYLSKQNIPIALRTMLIRSVLLPIASYGGEIFGMSQARTSFEIDVKESHSYTFPTVYKAEIKFKKRRRRTDSERRALPTNSVSDTNQIRQLILWQLNSATYLTEITPEMVTKFTEDEDNLGKKKRLSRGNSTIAPHSFVLVSIVCRLTNAPWGEGPAQLHIALQKVSSWAEQWEMQVNASKCGVMGICASTNCCSQCSIMWSRKLSNQIFGLDVQQKLEPQVGFLLPVAAYDGELFGMNMSWGTKIKSIIDNACRAVMDCDSSAALFRLRDKLKIATVNTRTAVAPPMISRLSTWGSGTTKWVKRYCQNMVPGQTVKALTLRALKNDKSKITAWIDQIMAGRIRSVGLLELIYPEYSQ
ncbi:hypothetical protein BB561_004543, partial [Smittium simulii]